MLVLVLVLVLVLILVLVLVLVLVLLLLGLELLACTFFFRRDHYYYYFLPLVTPVLLLDLRRPTSTNLVSSVVESYYQTKTQTTRPPRPQDHEDPEHIHTHTASYKLATLAKLARLPCPATQKEPVLRSTTRAPGNTTFYSC